jgi:bacterioferritin
MEMTHAEEIAERLVSLGGTPTTEPTKIAVPSDTEEMLKVNLELEEGATKLYRRIIDRASTENDSVTRKLFEEILEDEEHHHSTFTTLLETIRS